MFKKIILFIVIVVVIAALSGAGYYLYRNVYNNQYEMTYELSRSENDDATSHRHHKFMARNDSVAAEEAVFMLMSDFTMDNQSLEESKYIYHYDNLRLDNVTKDTNVRVPVKLVRNILLLDDKAAETYKLNERVVDWITFTDEIPYWNYYMNIYLDNPYEEKDLRFIANSDYAASEKAIDTLAYYISKNWYYAKRPVDDVLVVNSLTMDFVHALSDNYVWLRITNSPYCKGLNLDSYPIRYRGLLNNRHY